MVARKAFTLLEVLLALFLTTITVGLLAMAIKVNADVADKAGDQVVEAQLARALLQRIANDLRNTPPYQAPSSNASGQSGASSTGGTGGTASALASSSSGATTSSGSGSTASSTSSSSSDVSEVPVAGGIFGTEQAVRVETSHRPRATKAMLATLQNGATLGMLSDIREVTYTLGPPDGSSAGSAPVGGGASSALGLYRSDMERMEYYTAMQQGGVDPSQALTERLAAEVADLKFTYYDGSTANDEWDSNEQGKLPSSVRVTISIRAPAKKSSGGSSLLGGGSDERPSTVYSMLVDLPNASATPLELEVTPADLETGKRGMSSSSGSSTGG